MKRVGIVVNRDRPNALKVLEELKAWLEKRGLEVLDDSTTSREEIPKQSDGIIVLGGDGTLLNLARFMREDSGPILGVNLGGLGFLTETTLDELYPALERMLKGEYGISERMMLEAKVPGKEEKYLALNDIVITRSATPRIISLTIRIDDEEVSSFLGDGLIISTPTGSTAYALSGGGPIVYPTVDSCIIIPICPHTLRSRPLVSPSDKEITITFGFEAGHVVLVIDGQQCVKLGPKDEVKVTTPSTRIKLIAPHERSYWQILKEKLGIK